jgi:plastocyanin
VRPRAVLLGCAVGAAFLTPTAAMAATKTVFMGLPSKKVGNQFQKLNGDDNAFFPRSTAIHAGDKVSFVVTGFHTLDLPAKGVSPLALLAPTGTTLAGQNDAAGQPFWFNGQPELGFNPPLLASGFGKHFTYTGAKRVESGLPVANNPKPVLVTFKKAGTYTYFCDVHAGMKGTIHVLAKSHKVPSAAADAKSVATQAANALKILKSINQTTVGSSVVQIGASGKNGVESYNFFPATSSVKVGTTVTFRMPVTSTEVHTATTGPGNPLTDPNSYLGQLSATFTSPVIAGAAVYPSDQPGGTPASLTPTLHGNGFWNSGVLDTNINSPLPGANQVTFAGAGTYTFYCLIHPFMKATVNVTS